MSVSQRTDPLLDMVKQIKNHAEENGFVVYYGWASGGKIESVYWNVERDGDWRHFLKTAKALSVKLVYLNWAPFEEFQVEEALVDEESHTADAPSGEDIREKKEHNSEVAKFRDYVGLTAIIDLAYLFDGVLHIFQKKADWFEEFEELTAKEEAEEEAETGEEEVDAGLVNIWAGKLVRELRYRTCKTHGQRSYLLEKLAGDEYGRLPVLHILERAENVYAIDVRPEEDKELRKQAKELKAEGLNIIAIAQRLGLTREKVSGLLSR